MFFALFCGALCRSLLAGTKVPYTVALLVVGLCLGFLHAEEDLGVYARPSIEQWVRIDPHLLLYAFLPPLVFESAFNLEWHMFTKLFSQALLMATVGVVLTVGIVGAFLKWCLPYDWSWEFSFMTASILAATDPVAVVALLNDLGASKTLSMLIEGESMMNDGTAIVMFLLFFDFSKGNDKTTGEIIEFFLQVPLAGPAIGIAFGMATLWWLGMVYNDALVDISLTVVDCYLVYFVSEEVSGSSGVLGVVGLGAYLAAVGKPYFATNKEVEESLHHFWSMMTYGANTLIFILAGVIIAATCVDDQQEQLEWRDLGYAVLLYLFLNAARGFVVMLLFPLLSRIGYGLDWRNAAIVVYGGLRGAVGLALALIVFEEHALDEKNRTRVLFHVGFIVVSTLGINGSTTGMLLHWLGLDTAGVNRDAVVKSLHDAMGERVMKKYLEEFHDDTLGGADFDRVKAYVSSLRMLDEKKSPNIERLQGFKTETEMKAVASEPSFRSHEQAILEDLRKRLLSSVRLSYKELSEEGEGNSNAIFMLMESVDKALDDTSQTLNDWSVLDEQFAQMSGNLGMVSTTLRLVPIPAAMRKMMGPCDRIKEAETKLIAAWSFVRAHEHACKSLHDQVGSIDEEHAKIITTESKVMVEKAKAFIRERRVAFPELVETIKTSEVARELLNVQEHFVKDQEHTGLLDQSELDALHDLVQRDFRKYVAAPPSAIKLTDDEVIRGLPVFNGGQGETLYDTFRADFKPVTSVEIGKPLYTKGETGDKVYFIGRGCVSATTEPLSEAKGAELPKERVYLDRSRMAGWVCGLYEVLAHKDGNPPPTRKFTVVCETVLMAYEVDGAVVRKMAAAYPQVEQALWQAAAGMLCETVLRSDLRLPVGLPLQQSIALGTINELVPEVTESAKELAILMEGTVQAPGGQEVTAPALLSHSKSLAAGTLTGVSGGRLFRATLQNELAPGGMPFLQRMNMLITATKGATRGLADEYGLKPLGALRS